MYDVHDDDEVTIVSKYDFLIVQQNTTAEHDTYIKHGTHRYIYTHTRTHIHTQTHIFSYLFKYMHPQYVTLRLLTHPPFISSPFTFLHVRLRTSYTIIIMYVRV